MRNPTIATEGPLTPRLCAILESVDPGASKRVSRVMVRQRRTNLVSEIHLTDGRALIVKQGRSDAAPMRFATAHAASILLRGAGIEMPLTQILPDDETVLVYWCIDRATLHDTWATASGTRRRRLLESWGVLLDRLHAFELRGFGPLSDPVLRRPHAGEFLRDDIEQRLLALLQADLPDAVESARALASFAAQLPATRSVVVHNDVFDQNVLCDDDRCTGLIDFEDAFAGPPEADFAKLELLHGPLFGQPWAGDWLDIIRDTYTGALDEQVTAAFRCHALLNMSWHGVTIGLREHSRLLAVVAASEAALLGHGASHREAVDAARVS